MHRGTVVDTEVGRQGSKRCSVCWDARLSTPSLSLHLLGRLIQLLILMHGCQIIEVYQQQGTADFLVF